jgi:hypothetical protein
MDHAGEVRWRACSIISRVFFLLERACKKLPVASHVKHFDLTRGNEFFSRVQMQPRLFHRFVFIALLWSILLNDTERKPQSMSPNICMHQRLAI